MRIIVNGKAAASLPLRQAVQQVRSDGLAVEIRVTWEAGDAIRYAAEAVRDGEQVVVAAGGDGTLNEVVNGLLQADASQETTVGILPFGTANDFATGCGIPRNDPAGVLRLIAEGKSVPVDVGKANDRYFINVVSGGFGAEVTASTSEEMKQLFGGAAYSLMGIVTAAKMTPYHARITTDDTWHEGKLLVITVANGVQCGGGIQVAPTAVLDDGLLDVMVIHDVELPSLGAVFTEITHLGSPDNEHVYYEQVPSLKIETDHPIRMSVDGEPVLDTSFQFEVLPKRLRMILTPQAPLADEPS